MPATTASKFETVSDLQRHLGGVPLRRIRMSPVPGKATERDLLRHNERSNKRYELIDAILVEKAMGFAEGFFAIELACAIRDYLRANDLGIVAGADSPVRFGEGLVRLPDLCVITWKRLPNRLVPLDPISSVVPEVAIEVLSPSNRKGEMRRKLREYFNAGVREAWVFDPRRRTMEVFTSPKDSRKFGAKDTFDGGTVLPGFSLVLSRLFEHLPVDKRT